MAGLKSGDTIISINDVKVDTWNQMSELIHNNPDKNIRIKWKSVDENIFLENDVSPYGRLLFKDGKMINIGIIGIYVW